MLLSFACRARKSLRLGGYLELTSLVCHFKASALCLIGRLPPSIDKHFQQQQHLNIRKAKMAKATAHHWIWCTITFYGTSCIICQNGSVSQNLICVLCWASQRGLNTLISSHWFDAFIVYSIDAWAMLLPTHAANVWVHMQSLVRCTRSVLLSSEHVHRSAPFNSFKCAEKRKSAIALIDC